MKLPNYNQRLLTIEKRTRRFMLGAVAVLLLVLAMIASRQDYFSRSTTILFFTPNAQGLNKGMAVKFVGFKVGSVQDVSMQPNATVRVSVSLDNEYVHLIGQDAKARLIKEALVGESVVEIIPGSQQVRQVAQGSVLEFERGQDASTVVENLAAQVQPILSDIRQITSSINNPNGDIQQTLRNLNQASGGFRETMNQFNKLGTNGNIAVERLNSSLETLDKGIPRLMDKAEAAMSDVQSAASGARKIISESGTEVPSLVRNSNALVQDSREVLGGMKKSWLLNSYFPAPQEQALPVDGYVAPNQP